MCSGVQSHTQPLQASGELQKINSQKDVYFYVFYFFTSHGLDDASGDGVVAVVDVSKQGCGALLDVRGKRLKSVLCIGPNAATCSSLQVEVICRKFSSLKKNKQSQKT